MSSDPKTILVAGATGRQGRAVVQALSSLNHSSKPPLFRILALIRSPSSSHAQSLLALNLPGVQLHQGNLDSPSVIFASAGGTGSIWGVFSMQNNRQGGGGIEGEKRQRMGLAREAERMGVKCFVYSGVYIGRVERSVVPQFDSKLDIEAFLRTSVPDLPWTILQPVYFMDNLTPTATSTVQGKLLATMFIKGTFSNSQNTQLVAVSDLGKVAAKVFRNPEQFQYKTLGLAGDDLTIPQLLTSYRRTIGRDMPTTFTFWANLIKNSMVELRTMFKFFGQGGEGVDIEALKKETGVELKTWEEFLRTECHVRVAA